MPLTLPVTGTQRGPVWTTASIFGMRLRFITPAASASTAWPTANTAILMPFTVISPVTFIELFFVAGTTPGTTQYDLGIYRDDFTRIVSMGATAAVSTTDAILPAGGGPIPATTLGSGRYYLAMNSAATTLTVRAHAGANGVARALGFVSSAVGAVALPASITPASMGTLTLMPLLGMASVNNVL